MIPSERFKPSYEELEHKLDKADLDCSRRIYFIYQNYLDKLAAIKAILDETVSTLKKITDMPESFYTEDEFHIVVEMCEDTLKKYEDYLKESK